MWFGMRHFLTPVTLNLVFQFSWRLCEEHNTFLKIYFQSQQVSLKTKNAKWHKVFEDSPWTIYQVSVLTSSTGASTGPFHNPLHHSPQGKEDEWTQQKLLSKLVLGFPVLGNYLFRWVYCWQLSRRALGGGASLSSSGVQWEVDSLQLWDTSLFIYKSETVKVLLFLCIFFFWLLYVFLRDSELCWTEK